MITSLPIVTRVASKADVNLDQVDNTADIDKPVSTAQQTAINTAVANAAAAAVPDAAISTKGVVQLTGALGGTADAPTALGYASAAALGAVLAAKADTSALASKAPLDSPAFTGTPAVPTATPGDATTQIASTAFVTAAVASVVAGGATDASTSAKGLVQLAGALGGTAVAPTALGYADAAALASALAAKADASALAAKAPLASPALTGVPTAPTAAGGTATTQIASTAFVDGVRAALQASISAKADSSALASKADTTYVDTGLAAKAPLANPALTGVPTAPTAAPGNSTAQIASTAFVDAVRAALQASVNAKADTTYVDTGLAAKADASALAAKAPLASPALTGTPTAPTAAPGTATTQIASTAFVDDARSTLQASVDTKADAATVSTNSASINSLQGGKLAAINGAVAAIGQDVFSVRLDKPFSGVLYQEAAGVVSVIDNSYTWATRPDPTTCPGAVITISDWTTDFFSDGANWIPVGKRLVFVNTAVKSAVLTGNATNQILASDTIPAGLVLPNCRIEFRGLFTWTGSAAVKTPRVGWGGNDVYSASSNLASDTNTYLSATSWVRDLTTTTVAGSTKHSGPYEGANDGFHSYAYNWSASTKIDWRFSATSPDTAALEGRSIEIIFS